MEIRQSEVNGTKVIEVEGEVTMYNSQELRKAFQDLIKNKVKKLLIDLSGANYIDSSCLATLIEMEQKMKEIGGNIYISGVSGKVKSIFEITKMDQLFKIYCSRTDALEQIKNY